MSSTKFAINKYHQGQEIFKEGSTGKYVYIIINGKIEISKSINKKKIFVKHLEKGDVFGEMSLISNHPRTADAKAIEYSELVEIGLEKLNSEIKKTSPMVQKIILTLTERLESLLSEVQKYKTLPINEICYFLELLFSKSNDIEKHTIFLFDIYDNFEKILKLSSMETEFIIGLLYEKSIISIETYAEETRVVFPKIKLSNFRNKARSVLKLRIFKEDDMQGSKKENFINVYKAADICNIKPIKLIQNFTVPSFPVELLYFSKRGLSLWLNNHKDLFDEEETKSKIIGPKLVGSLEDLRILDEDYLKKLIGNLGFDETSELIACISEKTQKRILSILPKERRSIIEKKCKSYRNQRSLACSGCYR